MNVVVIAEAGVNHNGDIRLAKRLIEAAKWAGADYVKFQTFISENLVSSVAEKADYQKKASSNHNNEESQLEMLKQLELSREDFIELKKYCGELEIGFLSTPFDLESIDFLEELNMDFWKIPSGEITNLPYLLKIRETKRPIVLSTGMSNLEEITEAISTLEEKGSRDIKILHCTTEYPAPLEEVNLKAMITMKDVFQKEVGYSDHTQGIDIPIAAVALGATVIEKHFTLDKGMEGPDHQASLEPSELKDMVDSIRRVQLALGNGEKLPTLSEEKNMKVARKSIVAKKEIKCGEEFTESNITVKRPGNGLSPMKWFNVLGNLAKRDFEKDELIEL